MTETYDIIICGAGSGGGFFAGEVAPYASTLILDAGPHIGGDALPGVGSDERRRFSTQINLGTFVPDGVNSRNAGKAFFAYPIYQDQSNPTSAAIQREARVVGGGSFINVGAWLRPIRVDWEGFAEETGVEGWTREAFEPHFQHAETVLHVHRNKREHWNRVSVLYEQAARSLGIPTIETASNRYNCIFCGHRLNAGVPCKYDALMSTALTQIPKAIQHGAVLHDNASVKRVLIENRKAVGVVYERNGELIEARARNLVVVSAGAVGTPAILYDSGLADLNTNVGRYLRAHPGIAMDALLPGGAWGTDRGYQWNFHHFVTDDKGNHIDVVVHPSAGFPAATPWVAAQVGFFGKPYKDLMRRYPQRAGAFLFQLKPSIHGRVVGGVAKPVLLYPTATPAGTLEPKLLDDLVWAVRQVHTVFRKLGAVQTFPNPNQPASLLHRELTTLVTTAGALHPQGTCRAAANRDRGVVDTNCMSFDVENLMCCDASVIPHHISSNPNAMIMAVASRAAAFVNSQILDRRQD
ncbi:MAG: GMC family oxidoreductase [Bryobacterales bacterium]|nr:GMC family oxidoreductase [Bryobacterales bacterium]